MRTIDQQNCQQEFAPATARADMLCSVSVLTAIVQQADDVRSTIFSFATGIFCASWKFDYFRFSVGLFDRGFAL